MSTYYAPEVDAGIALLDTRVPEWRDRVNVDSLRLVDCKACVLGQVFGEYEAGLTALGLGYDDSDDYGFSIPDDDTDHNVRWGWLTRTWKAALR